MNGAKLPHTLRMIILLLRLTLGLDFFYLGWSMLFDQPLGHVLGERSLGNLYAWMGGAVSPAGPQIAFAWAFMVIGACLAVGFLTRIASIAGIVLTLMSYVPNVSLSAFAVTQLINDSVIVILCLFVILFSGAGEYFGIDRFIHVGLGAKQKNIK